MCTNESRHSNMLPVGTVLRGTYRIEKHLASGGFGNTYLAKNTAFDEVCAIKEFFIKGVCERDDDTCTVSVSNSENTLSFEQQRGKFKKEARRLRSIRNEHVVQVHDLFEENGTAYYVMDFVDGCSLSAQLKSMGKGLAEEMVWDYLRQVLDGLAAVHAAGIWHLDIKPGNIMIDKQGCVKLIDFGASKQSDAEGGVTTSSAICYTPGYAPSEQMAQSYDKFGPWTDFYALGATLYKLLANQTPPLPIDLSEDETADKRATLPMPGVSEKMRSLVVWMMQVSRLKRPKDVAEIQHFMEGEVSQDDPGDEDTQVIMPTSDPKPHANPASEPSPKPDSGVAGGGPKQGKNKTLVVVLSVFALLCVAGLGYALYEGNNTTFEEDQLDSTVVNVAPATDTAEAEEQIKEPEPTLEPEGAPLSEGEKADGRGGFDDNAEGYFSMHADEYMTENRDVYFDGSFSDTKGSYPIMLKFEMDDNYFPGVCYYHNITYDTKLKMSVRFTEEEMIIRGKANGSDFVMNFTPTTDGKWKGRALSGSYYLNAEIRPRSPR